MRKLTVLLAVLALASACTSDPEPWTPVPHPPAPRAPDRDERAVLNALVTLDPCALLGHPKGRYSRAPHKCHVALAGGTSVQAAVNERTGHADRHGLGTKEIGGVKVDAIQRLEPDWCSMEIPASFDYAIKLSLTSLDKKAHCDDLDKWGATVVANLGKLDAVRHPADRPDLSKDLCTVLAAAAADFDSAATFANEGHNRQSIDECFAKLDGFGAMSTKLVIMPRPPGAGWDKKWQTVDGKDVYTDDTGCSLAWSEGAYSADEDRVVIVDLGGCEPEKIMGRMRQLAVMLVRELAKPQAGGTVDRLTYRPGEADEPNPGACADYPADRCEPYQPTPVPDDAGQRVIAAATDPHVMCAVTLEAVHAQFPGLRPVVNSDVLPTCSYVEPSHAVELDLRAMGASTMLSTSTTRKLTIAGHPGEYSESTSEPRAALCFDTGQQNPKRGGESFWCGYATFHAAKIDKAGAAKLEPLMAAVAAKHFAAGG